MRHGWSKKKLGDVITLEYGKPLPKDQRCGGKEGFPAFGANGIKCYARKAYWKHPSIIVGRKGTAGAVNLVEGGFWPLDVTYYVTFDDQRHDRKFLYHMLSALNLPALATGVKPGINRNVVYALEQYFPPLPEQERIVAILDEAFAGIDTAIANTEKNLSNARELFEIVVAKRAFGDPDARGWSRTTVENLARPEKGSIRTGPFGSQLLHSEFVDDGIAVLGIDNAVQNEFAWDKRRYITEEKYSQLKRYTVYPGDVLITIMGTCGRCAVVPADIPPSINSKHLCCISLDQRKCIPEFLHSYFLYHPIARDFLESRAKGSIMSGLNMGIIKELPVWHPDVQSQEEVVEFIDEIREATRRLEVTYHKKNIALSELKQSLLKKAFSGELTAKDKEVPDPSLKEEEVT